MILAQKIRGVLLEGPATCNEIAIELGMDKERIHTNLMSLVRHNHVKVVSKLINSDHARSKRLSVYALTNQGKFLIPVEK